MRLQRHPAPEIGRTGFAFKTSHMRPANESLLQTYSDTCAFNTAKCALSGA